MAGEKICYKKVWYLNRIVKIVLWVKRVKIVYE